jgi:hypothetical protein
MRARDEDCSLLGIDSWDPAQLHPALLRLSAMISPVLHSYRKFGRTRLPSPMANQSKTPEAYVSDALDLMKKARWVKQYGQSAKGLRVDWTDRGKLAMDALGYVIEDLGPESLNQQLWWAVGTLAAVHMMP